MHGVFLVTQNHHLPSLFFMSLIKTKNSNEYMMPKFNFNMKFKLNLR